MSELKDKALQFMASFNGKDLDAVMKWFSDDSEYIDPQGNSYKGVDNIRAALAFIFDGTLGEINYKVTNYLVDEHSKQILVNWILEMKSPEGATTKMRALDILSFKDGKVFCKDCYSKSAELLIEEA